MDVVTVLVVVVVVVTLVVVCVVVVVVVVTVDVVVVVMVVVEVTVVVVDVVVVEVVGQSPSPPMQSDTSVCAGHARPVTDGWRVMVIVRCNPLSHAAVQWLNT